MRLDDGELVYVSYARIADGFAEGFEDAAEGTTPGVAEFAGRFTKQNGGALQRLADA